MRITIKHNETGVILDGVSRYAFEHYYSLHGYVEIDGEVEIVAVEDETGLSTTKAKAKDSKGDK
jgi:hypothetical protein